MTQIKRLIDLKTLRRNPDAGRSEFLVAGQTYVPHDRPNTIVREFQRVYTMAPEPEWLYEFEPLDIICVYCGQESPIESLKEDYTCVDEDEYIISDICPKCGDSNCAGDLLVTRETLTAALARKKDA